MALLRSLSLRFKKLLVQVKNVEKFGQSQAIRTTGFPAAILELKDQIAMIKVGTHIAAKSALHERNKIFYESVVTDIVINRALDDEPARRVVFSSNVEEICVALSRLPPLSQPQLL